MLQRVLPALLIHPTHISLISPRQRHSRVLSLSLFLFLVLFLSLALFSVSFLHRSSCLRFRRVPGSFARTPTGPSGASAAPKPTDAVTVPRTDAERRGATRSAVRGGGSRGDWVTARGAFGWFCLVTMAFVKRFSVSMMACLSLHDYLCWTHGCQTGGDWT